MLRSKLAKKMDRFDWICKAEQGAFHNAFHLADPKASRLWWELVLLLNELKTHKLSQSPALSGQVG